MVKLYKYKKLIICIIIVLGVVITFVNSHTASPVDTSIHHTYEGISYIKSSSVIDKDIVIRSLSTKHQLVGLGGHVTKTYTYTDSLFKDQGMMKDWLGKRSLQIDVNAFFKTGISLSDISPDDISVYGNTLFIKIPKQILISLDVPYDQTIFKPQTGILRSELTEVEKQQLYTEVRKLLTDNIMTDKSIETQTVDGVKEALNGLLSKVPNLNRIVFQSK